MMTAKGGAEGEREESVKFGVIVCGFFEYLTGQIL